MDAEEVENETFYDERIGFVPWIQDKTRAAYETIDSIVFGVEAEGYRNLRWRYFVIVAIIFPIILFLVFIGLVVYENKNRPTPFPSPPPLTPLAPGNSKTSICDNRLVGSNGEVCESPLGLCRFDVFGYVSWTRQSVYGPNVQVNDPELRALFPSIRAIYGGNQDSQDDLWRAKQMILEPNTPKETLDALYFKIRQDYRAANPGADVVAEFEYQTTLIYASFMGMVQLQASVGRGQIYPYLGRDAVFRILIPDAIWRQDTRDDDIPCGCYCNRAIIERPEPCQSLNCT